MIKDLPQFQGLNCTINTTENCNLRCKYCYEVNKRDKHIDFDMCKKFIDMVTDTDRKDWPDRMIELSDIGLIFDFIGGDSLVNPKLLDRIARYIMYRLTLVNHPARSHWRMSISTNGTLFANPDVRKFCEEWRNMLCVGISIDGCPEIHDMNRVFPDGSGSMAVIKEWLPWYRSVFNSIALSTKSTCAKNSIPYLYDSLRYMHEVLGYKYIHQNFIMEDTGCTEDDYKLLDEQLGKCVDYVYEHRDSLYWSMIDRSYTVRNDITKPLPDEGRCGSGCMPCLSITGKIYPCFRWMPVTQTDYDKNTFSIAGDANKGEFYFDTFKKVTEGAWRSNCTKDEKCRTCEYESCCPYCIGGCYSEYGEFRRTTHICEITKLQAKWADIYWRKYDSREI